MGDAAGVAASRVRASAGIPELDGLRGLAILLVLARHGVRPFWSDSAALLPLGGWDAATPLINGWAGVDLFFVLSGFLIAHHLLRRWGAPGREGWLGDYVWRRLLRIVPAYYVVLVVVAAGWVPLYPMERGDLAARVVYHLLFLQDYLPADLVVAFWSLGVEVKFYLLAPFLLLAALRLSRPSLQYAALGSLVALPLGSRVLTWWARPDVIAYAEFFAVFRSPLHQCADALIVGVLCALVYRDRLRAAAPSSAERVERDWLAPALGWGGVLGAVALLCWVPLLEPVGPFDKTLLPTALALSMGGLVLGSALGGGPVRLLRAPWLRFFARISYSLYLVHLLFLPGVRATLIATLGIDAWSPAARFALVFPVFALVSTAGAVVLHRLVERPCLRLKDRVPWAPAAAVGTP